MTCIAAIKHPDGAIHLAADREQTQGWIKVNLGEPKIFKREKFVYGVCGYSRIADIMRRVFNEPPRLADQDTLRYISGVWVNAWRQCLQECGVKHITENEDRQNSSILMVYEGRMFAVSSNFSVTECLDYLAMGSGGDVAMGALYAAKDVVMAVSAAIEHAVGCGGSVDLMEISPNGDVKQNVQSPIMGKCTK